ncbi:L,D-transpeptidase, partial [Ligilactobacillus salivarius]
IWLTVPDAEWIQKNLPVGTKVLIYGEDANSDNFIADNAKH